MIWPASSIYKSIKTVSQEVCEEKLRAGDVLKYNSIVGLPFGAFLRIYARAFARSWLSFSLAGLLGWAAMEDWLGFFVGAAMAAMFWLALSFFCLGVPGRVAQTCRTAPAPPPVLRPPPF